jgi:bifunctional oligoribonuclease and PAP phosphatase NrnA
MYYKKPTKEFVVEFSALVKQANSIVITSHKSPDDDSIASVLALYYYLIKKQKISQDKVKMIISGDSSDRWLSLKYYKNIQYVSDISSELANIDLLIMLDGSGWARITNTVRFGDMFGGQVVCIDHHPNPEDTFFLHLIDKKAASTTDIIYRMFFDESKITKDLAEIILLGIWGDTGGFRFVRPDKSYVLEVVAKIIRDGDIDLQTFLSKFQRIDYSILKLIGKLINNTKILKIVGWPDAQVSYLDRRILSNNDMNDISYAYHLYIDTYVRFVKEADWGFVVIPKSADHCGVSFRSLPGSVNVRLVAEGLNGGGHDRASGGKVQEINVHKALQEIVKYLETNKPELS